MKSKFSSYSIIAALYVGLVQNLWAFQNVPVQFAAGPVQLAGTLTLPDTPGPSPALVLIAGGQPIDRDASYSGGRYKFFKIIAEDLAKHGFATLRYDSPGVGGSTGNWNQRTLGDRADEAASGINFLKQDRRIDAQRIGLLGHSEGTDVALLVAARDKDAAFLVLLSPHAKSGHAAFAVFRAYLNRENGVSESKEDEAAWDDFYERTVWPAVGRGQTNWQEILEQGKMIARKQFDKMPAQQQSKYKDFDAYFQSTVDSFYLTYAPTAIPHLRSMMDFDPLKFYEQIHCPILLVGGESDFFATDIPVLADTVHKSGNTNYVTKIMPMAGHTLDNPAVSSEEPVPELLPAISGWLEITVSTSRRETQ